MPAKIALQRGKNVNFLGFTGCFFQVIAAAGRESEQKFEEKRLEEYLGYCLTSMMKL